MSPKDAIGVVMLSLGAVISWIPRAFMWSNLSIFFRAGTIVWLPSTNHEVILTIKSNCPVLDNNKTRQSANRVYISWDVLYIWNVMNKIDSESCMYSSDELFQRSREGHFGVYFPSCEATREINTKITLEWAQKQFVTRVHALFYFLHDITNPNMTIMPLSHSFGFRSAGDVTIACWWRHNDQTIVTWSRE